MFVKSALCPPSPSLMQQGPVVRTPSMAQGNDGAEDVGRRMKEVVSK